MKLAQNTNEKRKVFVRKFQTSEQQNALNTAAEFLTDAELQNEAEVAVVRIARHTRGNFPQETKAVLLKVVNSQNGEVSNDARRYLKEIDK